MNKNEEVIYDKQKFKQLFDLFADASSPAQIIKYFSLMCQNLNINAYEHYSRDSGSQLLYQLFQDRAEYWRTDDLWAIYDKKLSDHRNLNIYPLRILIVGCGPVGLRLSIECALLGLNVVVIDKRDQFSRNNVLILWPYVTVDLENIGAQQFYGDTWPEYLRQIIALLVGVEVHFNVSFEGLIEPDNCRGWRARLPFDCDHRVADYDFDVIIAADGAHGTMPGFKFIQTNRKQSICISASFVNHQHSDMDVQEINSFRPGFNRNLLAELREKTGVDLINIVYLTDETHYCVMEASKDSLLRMGILIKDSADTKKLLAKENIEFRRLCDCVMDVAAVLVDQTAYPLEFTKTASSQPDLAMFDSSVMQRAEHACRFHVVNNRPLLMGLVGDNLISPDWTKNTGIGLGFLGALDTAWMIRDYGLNLEPHELIAKREQIYEIMCQQLTKTGLNPNYHEYSLDPSTRYMQTDSTHEKSISEEDQLARPLMALDSFSRVNDDNHNYTFSDSDSE